MESSGRTQYSVWVGVDDNLERSTKVYSVEDVKVFLSIQRCEDCG